MRKAILLLVAAAACVIFTACPDKPDEVVVIPDGLYEETAHLVRYEVEDWGPAPGKETLVSDSVYVTQVLIDQGEFIYQDMCADTFLIINSGKIYVRYNPHFIYLANAYCPEVVYQDGETQVDITVTATNPAHMSSDGFVVIPTPWFSDFSKYSVPYRMDSNYVYRAPVSKNGDVFCFEQNHEFTARNFIYKYYITHTLRPL